jgi:hypothetical protein
MMGTESVAEIPLRFSPFQLRFDIFMIGTESVAEIPLRFSSFQLRFLS